MSNRPLSYDLHVHTEFSPDSTTPLEAYAKLAEQLSIHVGFLDHFELAFLDHADYLNFSKLPELLEEYDRIHSNYPHTSIGLELDYYSDLSPQVTEFCDDYQKDFDYFIGVVHTVDRVAVTTLPEFDSLVTKIGLKKILERYFAEVEAAIRSKLFTGLAHIDGVMRFFPRYPGCTELIPFWKSRTKELGLLCQHLGIIIEVNLRGLILPWGRMHPDSQLISELIQADAKFYVGSDSHCLKDFENAASQIHQMNAFLANQHALQLPESIRRSILHDKK